MPAKVAVDIDDVLLDFVTPFLRWHNRRYGTRLQRADVGVGMPLWEVWGGTREDAAARIPAFFREVDLRGVEPLPAAGEVLARLKGAHRLVVVSGRDPALEGLTRAWLEKYFAGVFDDVVLGGAPHGHVGFAKSTACTRIGAGTLIDDNLGVAADCAGMGIRTLLFGDYPWNRTRRLPARVVRVRGWRDVDRVLRGGTGPRERTMEGGNR